jgi:hypothetical protein
LKFILFEESKKIKLDLHTMLTGNQWAIVTPNYRQSDGLKELEVSQVDHEADEPIDHAMN